MNFDEYLSASENTEKKFPEGLAVSARDFNRLVELFGVIGEAAGEVDNIKKRLIYSSPDLTGLPSVTLTQRQAEFLHACMGMITETVEIVECVGAELKVSSEVHFMEEVGDLMWYLAIFMRNLDLPLEKTLASNIRKLAARYPEKFTNEAAMNRDKAAETAALTGE